ncbi:50S ribosomal protein L24 [Candidatus Woesearchaeota archaeon]|nr:50S ribosomal protein L24 [Candidatus Woesearchaeota archaeon]
MKKKFSLNWIGSKQPRKQRKYVKNAPLNILKNFIRANLSKELRQKLGKRNVGVRKGDAVKIVRGQFKGTLGKIEKVWLKRSKVYVDTVTLPKRDGSKRFYPLSTSNLQVTELVLEDKKRKKVLERK